MGAFFAYPSHRYHPSLEEGKSEIVANEAEDAALEESDPLWRDLPYSDAERAEWKDKHPKAKASRKPVPGQAEVADEPEEVDPHEAKKPRRENFSSKAKFNEAMKAWQKEK